MTRRDFQQTVDAVASRVILIACQLQTNARDFHRNRVAVSQLSRSLQVLISAGFVTALLRCFGRQQIVHHRLFGVVGVFRHQLFNLLIVTLCELKQRLLGLFTGAAALTANEPAAGMGTGTENTAQDPLDRKQHHHAEDQNDRQTRYAGFNVVVIGLDQDITLMTRKHRSQDDPGDQQDKE